MIRTILQTIGWTILAWILIVGICCFGQNIQVRSSIGSNANWKLADAQAALITLQAYNKGLIHLEKDEVTQYYCEESAWLYGEMTGPLSNINDVERKTLTTRYNDAMSACKKIQGW